MERERERVVEVVDIIVLGEKKLLRLRAVESYMKCLVWGWPS
jgi:hypothetical protein